MSVHTYCHHWAVTRSTWYSKLFLSSSPLAWSLAQLSPHSIGYLIISCVLPGPITTPSFRQGARDCDHGCAPVLGGRQCVDDKW